MKNVRLFLQAVWLTTTGYKLNQELIDLNHFLEENIQESDNIFSIHFKLPKTNANDFESSLVAIPKNLTDSGLIDDDKLKYDYFQIQC